MNSNERTPPPHPQCIGISSVRSQPTYIDHDSALEAVLISELPLVVDLFSTRDFTDMIHECLDGVGRQLRNEKNLPEESTQVLSFTWLLTGMWLERKKSVTVFSPYR